MLPPSSPGNLARTAVRGFSLGLIVALCGAAAPAKAPLVAAPVHVHGMSYDRPRHSLVLTITGPVTISTRALKNPARLVVDIPAASLDSPNRELAIGDGLVTRVRVSQFQIIPPTVRVVIETATAEEPIIAVQQTGKKLYVTLGAARPAEAPDGLLPSPGPEPSSFTPPTRVEETAAPAPATPTPRPVVATPTPTPRPTATPAPVPTPTPTRGIQTRLRPGMPIPTPQARRTQPPMETPPPAAATPRPATPTPLPVFTQRPVYRPIDAEPTPIPPSRGSDETFPVLP